MRFFKNIDRLLLQRWPRYRLWRICKAIGIKPYKWQREYALAPVVHLIPDNGRGTGKTTAVMLRLLMHPPRTKYILETTLWADPDYKPNRKRLYREEYDRLRAICDAKGITDADKPIDRRRIWWSAVDYTGR